MTIERSHEAPHLARPRLSALETVDTEERRARNHGAGGRFLPENDAARESGSRRELTRTLKAVRDSAQDAPGGAIATPEAREVARAALRLYGSARRALGTDAVPVLARLKRAAVNDALADYYTSKASEAGFDTERGLALLDAAHRCEGRAERGTTAALAFQRALAEKRPEDPGAAHRRVFEAFGQTKGEP